MFCVICLALTPGHCSRWPNCSSHTFQTASTAVPSPPPPPPPPPPPLIVPSPVMRTYNDWHALKHGRRPPLVSSYARLMTEAEYDTITQVRAKAAEDKEKQQSNLITWSQIQNECCVDSDGDKVIYSKHLKIVKQILGKMNKNPLRTEFDAAFLAAIKAESK